MTEKHQVVLLPSGRRGEVRHGTTLLQAAERLGVDIESICGGQQVCGKCLVSPEFGRFDKHGIQATTANISAPDAAEHAYAEQNGLDLESCRLSCAAQVLGDAVVHVPEASLTRKQVIRKAAGDIAVTLNPAVQLAYVDVEPSELGKKRGDWQRIQTALAEQHDLHNVGIDPVLLPRLQKTLRDGDWSLTLTVWQEREVISVEPGYKEFLYGLAVDVGSTTIVGHLCDLLTGQVLTTVSVMNPQVRYGEDLMSRVSYSMMNERGLDKLHRSVIKALNDLAKLAAEEVEIGPQQVSDVVLVGNTVMHHILLGIDPIELGGAPFALATQDAIDMKARDLGMTAIGRGSMVHVLPCVAGHVGADNVAVLLAEMASFGDDAVSLVVDVGTNAEILLGAGNRIYSASSPTGPAFEGAQIRHGQRAATGAIERVRLDRETGAVCYKVIGDERWSNELAPDETLAPTGICGSGIIEVIGELFLTELLDSGGLFKPDAAERCPAVQWDGRTAEVVLVTADKTAHGEPIIVTQQDIRAIQLAKGALYAGIQLLMDQMGVDHVDRVKLAGGFGSYIDPTYAMILGLIPDCDLDAVSAVGNAAGDGARIALLNYERRIAVQQAVMELHYVETAVEPRFQEHFVAAMALPHATALYPHLKELLPVTDTTTAELAKRGGRRRRRRRTG